MEEYQNSPNAHGTIVPYAHQIDWHDFNALVFLSAILGLAPVLPFLYYSIFGFSPSPYVTHQGPLWNSPWSGILLFDALTLLFPLPLITLTLGIYNGFRKKASIFLWYLALAIVQFGWGCVAFALVIALVD